MKRAVLIAITLAVSSSASADTKPSASELSQIRADLAAQRTINLERFRDYRLARKYPHNSYEVGVLNVWTDSDGHLCAVATMMDKGGLRTVVEKVGAEQNHVRIADVTSGPVHEWALTSGFTQEELVMIQQPSQADIDMMEALELAKRQKLKRAQFREDDRLEGAYLDVSKTLHKKVVADAALDLAAVRLAARPDLVKALRAKTAEAEAKKPKKPAKRA